MGKNTFRGGRLKISLCILLLLFGAGATLADSLPQPGQAALDQAVVARVSAEWALEHIAHLTENIGSRLGGMESEWEAADYIASVLESYGYAVEMQPFPVRDRNIGIVELPSGEQWGMPPAAEGRITGEDFVSGELIRVSGGRLLSNFPPETPGKIVLMRRDNYDYRYRVQVRNAATAGAIGVILFNPIVFPGEYGGAWRPVITPTDIPVLGGTWNQGDWLNDMLDQGSVTLRIQTKHYANLESVNVIARKPAKSGDPDAEAVLVTAHADSVPGAPGANDNASGVALALELARVLRDYNTDRELRFVLFGSEERGLLGSHYYVDQLSDAQLSRIVGVFNADMVATSDPESTHLYAMTVDGVSNLVSSAAEAAGSRLGNSSLLPGEFGRSDHVSFHEVGIPAALFIRVRADGSLEDFYHTPQDTLAENISPQRMQTSLDIVGAAVFDMIRKQVPALERSRVRRRGTKR